MVWIIAGIAFPGIGPFGLTPPLSAQLPKAQVEPQKTEDSNKGKD